MNRIVRLFLSLCVNEVRFLPLSLSVLACDCSHGFGYKRYKRYKRSSYFSIPRKLIRVTFFFSLTSLVALSASIFTSFAVVA